VLCKVGRYFQVRLRGSTFSTEIRAGIVTFLTVRLSNRKEKRLRAWHQAMSRSASSAAATFVYAIEKLYVFAVYCTD
jgi:hypothetical protein